MIDPKYNDLQFSPKWKSSSIAVFHHKLADIREEYCNRGTTYLRKSYKITNYQPESDSITVHDESLCKQWSAVRDIGKSE